VTTALQRGDGTAPARPRPRAAILHVRTLTRTGGGPEKTILLSARHLRDTDYWMAAAYLHAPADPGFAVVRQRAEVQGCPIIGIADRGPLDVTVVPALLAACRRLRIRIWHAHDYKANFIGLLLRPFHRMKLISTVHGWVEGARRLALYYAVDRQCLRFYDHVISVSDDLHERVRALGVPAHRCSLLRNGVDETVFLRQFPPARSPLRSAQALPDARLVVGAIGRLSAEKGFDDLIRAVPAVLRRGLDIELWIAGGGNADATLQALINAQGLGSRVKLLGFQEDTIALFHALDIFVLSSLREGLPNALLEAMAMGIPVVSTKVAGVRAVIRDGDTGLLCAPGDVDGLATCIARLASDPKLRERLASTGRRVIEQHFSFARRAAMELEVYDRVLGVGAARRSRPENARSGWTPTL
jgi:glycosyltransferase involved in cell wall biosynthesis